MGEVVHDLPSPHISYRWWRDRPSGAGIFGDGPELADVMEASAWLDGSALRLFVRGRMLRRDGEVSRVQRSVEVSFASTYQPPWLLALAEDARARLGGGL